MDVQSPDASGSPLQTGSQTEGSDPTPSSSVSSNPVAEIDELYRLKLNTLVKPYKNAQVRSATALGIINVNVSSLDAFTTAIFAIASQHVQGIAIQEADGFVMRQSQVSVEYLELMVSFKHRNHFYNVDSKLEYRCAPDSDF